MKSVLITGASTGIGKACAVYLAQKGYHVFACVRTEISRSSLLSEDVKNLQPILLDVTKSDTIKDAEKLVREQVGDKGLYALVNNAGVVVSGPLECLSINEIKNQFDVNVFGLIEVTQMFLPLLRQCQGRIVNISSISGRVSLPFLGPYCSSKFALEAFSDALRLEVEPFGIKVCLVEPGPIDTPIWKKSENRGFQNKENSNKEIMKHYEKSLQEFRSLTMESEKAALPVQKVVDAVYNSIHSNRPKIRYVIGAKIKLQSVLFHFFAGTCSRPVDTK